MRHILFLTTALALGACTTAQTASTTATVTTSATGVAAGAATVADLVNIFSQVQQAGQMTPAQIAQVQTDVTAMTDELQAISGGSAGTGVSTLLAKVNTVISDLAPYEPLLVGLTNLAVTALAQPAPTTGMAATAADTSAKLRIHTDYAALKAAA